ncbi:hypothetical protein QMK17_06925 [Rhodococcus sp. G-MC3]|uniref:hypothetical protein n=1 Tax=Rhodococcus sp. G-MC3 TaxID=3046209 RepID=UPI0024B9A8C5|nr:hypothetical protein [Rhodococcus sp. G-MC3]MDJ0393061.1 hypothetical protein [Rhodococcus sp. G-MC3]
MSTEHSDVAAELWALAQTVLTRLEPVLRQAMEDQRERPRQGCSWCPVCALAALIRGEQHDLLALLATEGASVVALLRQLIVDHSPSTPSEGAHASTPTSPGSDAPHGEDRDIPHDTDESVVRRTGFVPITVTVKDTASPRPTDNDS